MNRTLRRALIGTLAVAGGAAAAGAAAVSAERRAIRLARSAPDPARGEPLAERPGTGRRVRSFDGTVIDVRVAGAARRNRPTLVFAHGFSLDLTTWHFQWKALSERYRCVLFDQRGHGLSEPAGPAGYTVEALGEDLRAVLDATVAGGRAVLLGHSMGGMSVLSLAAQHPEEFGERVAGVVLADTGSAELAKEALGDAAVRVTASLRRALTVVGRRPATGARVRAFALGRGSDLAFLVTRAINFAPGAPPSLIDHVTRVASNTPAEVWPQTLLSLLDMDLRHAEGHVRVPALVVVGDQDRLTPPAAARRMAASLPRGRLAVIEGAGHVAMLERHERFNATVESFLESLTDDPAMTASA